MSGMLGTRVPAFVCIKDTTPFLFAPKVIGTREPRGWLTGGDLVSVIEVLSPQSANANLEKWP